MKWSQTSRFCEWLGKVNRALTSGEVKKFFHETLFLLWKDFSKNPENVSIFHNPDTHYVGPWRGEHRIWQRITNEKVILRCYAGRHETKSEIENNSGREEVDAQKKIKETCHNIMYIYFYD